MRAKHEPKCKICSSPHRQELEALFVKQQKREEDENGEKITLTYIIKHAANAWGMYLTHENIEGHLKKHFKVREAVAKGKELALKGSNELLESVCLEEILEHLDVQAVRREIIARALQKIREVDGENLTPDHLLKAMDLEMKEKSVNPLDALNDALANAVNFAVDVARGKGGGEVDVVIDIEDGEVDVGEDSGTSE